MLKDYIAAITPEGTYRPEMYAPEVLIEWAQNTEHFSDPEVIRDRMKLEDFPDLLSGSLKDTVQVALFAAYMVSVSSRLANELGLSTEEFIEKIETPVAKSFTRRVKSADGEMSEELIAQVLQALFDSKDGE